MPTGPNPSLLTSASSPSASKVVPPPPDTVPAGKFVPQQQASARSGAGELPTATAASTTATLSSIPPAAAAEEVLAAPTPAVAGGASSSIPPPTLGEPEVVLGRRLRSGVEPAVVLVPLPRVLSRAHQALQETEAAIRWEWEALESEHQRLGDWRTQLEGHTKAVSQQFAFKRSELAWDRKDYKKDLQKVYVRELEASRKQKRLAKKEEHLN
jgi:hypothetical protein